MKPILCFIIMATILPAIAFAQKNEFPQSWVGDWKGELHWYKGATGEPRKVKMEIRIHPAGNAGKYSWQIVYGSMDSSGKDTVDIRPYLLTAKDEAKGHWLIDENNGIVLDQFWVAGKFCGAFTVGNSTIVNSYWIENGKLLVEFFSLSAKPIATTGKGTSDSPSVDSYKMATYQKAVLVKQ